MKRLFAVLFVLLFCCGLAADAEIIDLTAYTQEELAQLRSDINARLMVAEEGQVLYDQGGIVVAWYGIGVKEYDSGNNYQLDYMISNEKDIDIIVDLDNIAVNGFLVSCSNTFSIRLPAHTSMFTAATYKWLFDDDGLKEIRFDGTYRSASATISLYIATEDGNKPAKNADPFTVIDGYVTISTED